jgi:hypothetical protein
MHTAILPLTVMVALLVGSGVVALAAVITCPTDPGGEGWGTTLADRIIGTIGVDQIYAFGGEDSVQGGGGDALIKGNLGTNFVPYPSFGFKRSTRRCARPPNASEGSRSLAVSVTC